MIIFFSLIWLEDKECQRKHGIISLIIIINIFFYWRPNTWIVWQYLFRRCNVWRLFSLSRIPVIKVWKHIHAFEKSTRSLKSAKGLINFRVCFLLSFCSLKCSKEILINILQWHFFINALVRTLISRAHCPLIKYLWGWSEQNIDLLDRLFNSLRLWLLFPNHSFRTMDFVKLPFFYNFKLWNFCFFFLRSWLISNLCNSLTSQRFLINFWSFS